MELLTSWATPAQAARAAVSATPTAAPPPAAPPPAPAPRRHGKPAFRPPTVEEVAEYCRHRGNGLDPQVFVDFYESKGWVVGRSPMRDWHAAVRTWEKRDQRDRSGSEPRRSGLAIGQVIHVDDGKDDWGF